MSLLYDRPDIRLVCSSIVTSLQTSLADGYLEIPELGFSPSSPSSDYGRLYIKEDGKIYFKNDGGSEYDLTSGGAPPATVYWIEEDGGTYVYPEGNTSARVYDEGQTFSYYYEGTNSSGAFFAGDDVGVIGHRAGTSSSDLPTFTNDEYPLIDSGTNAAINSLDEVTYTGMYAYGELYNGVTGISRWDTGIRGVGLGNPDGTNELWPVTGVMGEVLYDGSYNSGQQGVYGWNAASPADADFSIGAYGRTSQTGLMSAGVLGQYTASVGDLVEGFDGYGSVDVWGALGYRGDIGVLGYTDQSTGFGVYAVNDIAIESSSNPSLLMYYGTTWGGIRWNGTNMQYNNNDGGWLNIGSGFFSD
ncbi:hypothetical protein JXI42_09005 [bacterium]|nr:hypothetical protein [bacterium]